MKSIVIAIILGVVAFSLAVVVGTILWYCRQPSQDVEVRSLHMLSSDADTNQRSCTSWK